MASEVQQLIVIVLGKVPNRVDPKEAMAAERLVRVRHVTVARASELMEFALERPDWRERIVSVRAFEVALKELSGAYEAERQAKLRKQYPRAPDLSEMERLETMGRRGGMSAGERIDWLRDCLAELVRMNLSDKVRRAEMKRLLDVLHGKEAA